MNLRDIFTKYGPLVKVLTRRLEKVKIKTSKIRNDIEFLDDCQRHQIVPKAFKIKKKTWTPEESKILRQAERKLLLVELRLQRLRLRQLSDEDISLSHVLYSLLDNVDFHALLSLLDEVTVRCSIKHLAVLKKKFDLLCNISGKWFLSSQSSGSKQLQDNAVVNLSQENLDQQTFDLLSKGHNFGIKPETSSAIHNLISLNSLADSDVHLRHQLMNDLDHSISNSKKSTNDDVEIINKLKHNKNIILAKADKGGKLVILDKSDYSSKLLDIINSGYVELPRDPTNKLQACLRKFLKHNLNWDDKFVNELAPTHPNVPSIYGLPKLHKKDVPLRPIVNLKGSVFSGVSKFLSKSLRSLIKLPPSHVKNSSDFVKKLKSKTKKLLKHRKNLHMCSLDVVNMFPSINFNTALDILEERFNSITDCEFFDKVHMSKSNCLKLLKLILSNNYFSHNSHFYQLSDGLAMGSSLSPLLADIVLERIENDIMRRYNNNIKIWYRYVDDTFIIWEGDKKSLDSFIDDVNSFDPCIQFTVEHENNDSLTFLDTEIKLSDTGFQSTIYKKPTSSTGVLHFSSHHPWALKMNVAVQHISRIVELTSDPAVRLLKKREFRSTLLHEGYPPNLVNKIFQKQRYSSSCSNSSSATQKQAKGFTLLQYEDTLHQSVCHLKRQKKITRDICWGQKNSIYKTYKSRTTPCYNLNCKEAIYLIPCSCGSSYIGETKRPVSIRIKEHQRYVLNSFENSNIVQHLTENPSHNMWNEAIIIDFEQNDLRRKQIETLFITLNQDWCFSDPSVPISTDCLWVLNKHKRKKRTKFGFSFNGFA